MNDPKPIPNIGLIILAAGASTRMGTPKQLLLRDDRPLIRYVAQTAIATLCQPILVVLGSNIDKVRPTLQSLPIEIIENQNWQEGMGASIRVGLQELVTRSPEIEGAIFTVCDQPWLTTEAIDNLIQGYQKTGKAIAASYYDSVMGVPALFHCSIFPELLALQGKMGAKKVIDRDSHRVAKIAFPQGAIDLDTPQDYQVFQEAIATRLQGD